MHRECRMLHRDLKPQNILLSTHAVSGELIVRITDLGMASTYESKMSQSKGVAVGTHDYMSPEKVRDERAAFEMMGAKQIRWFSGLYLHPPFLPSPPLPSPFPSRR
jgi:serine/threonine protein kinase